jgi:DNA-binding transcriptional MerR regulator
VNTMTRSELARHLGVSRVTIWNYERRGLIPTPQRVSGNRTIFGLAAIMAAESAVLASKVIA